jgi:folate-binding protein YgfZ
MHNFVVGADNFDVVLAQGADVVRFLQGQLTCDVAALADNSLTHGACCNNKGRVIAGFELVRSGDIYYLCMARGLGAVLVAALGKYLPFYKCQLSIAADSHQLLGIAGADIIERLAGSEILAKGHSRQMDSGWLCKMDTQPELALWWCNNTPQAITTALGSPNSGTLAQWETLALLNGHYPFQVQDAGLYTPQDLNYDQNGYVNFAKGCYTGQEIVARMHYRGKPKKQLYLVQLAQAPTAADDKHAIAVTDDQGQTLGHCRLSRSCESLHLALVEMTAEFTGHFGALRVLESPVLGGCLFVTKVIQFSQFVVL